MDAPASKPREDSPASGPSPDVQVPGKTDHAEGDPGDEQVEGIGSDFFVEDGFGSAWEKCKRPDCGLQVVRPGKAQCAYDCHEPIVETQGVPV